MTKVAGLQEIVDQWFVHAVLNDCGGSKKIKGLRQRKEGKGMISHYSYQTDMPHRHTHTRLKITFLIKIKFLPVMWTLMYEYNKHF